MKVEKDVDIEVISFKDAEGQDAWTRTMFTTTEDDKVLCFGVNDSEVVLSRELLRELLPHLHAWDHKGTLELTMVKPGVEMVEIDEKVLPAPSPDNPISKDLRAAFTHPNEDLQDAAAIVGVKAELPPKVAVLKARCASRKGLRKEDEAVGNFHQEILLFIEAGLEAVAEVEELVKRHFILVEAVARHEDVVKLLTEPEKASLGKSRILKAKPNVAPGVKIIRCPSCGKQKDSPDEVCDECFPNEASRVLEIAVNHCVRLSKGQVPDKGPVNIRLSRPSCENCLDQRMMCNDSSMVFCGRGGAEPVIDEAIKMANAPAGGTAWVNLNWVCDAYRPKIASPHKEDTPKPTPPPPRMMKDSEDKPRENKP